jgi:dihydroorotase
MRFDLIIKGGEVVDPGAGLSGPLDIAIVGDRIAAVERDIPAGDAWRVVDASGHYVTPGLVDLHTHIYRGVGYFGVDADAIAWRCGVTTWVDAGSSGAFTIPGFRDYIVEPARVRIRAFIAMSYMGIPGLNYDEYAVLQSLDPEVLRRAVALNRDLVVGIKVRMGTGRTGYQGLVPLRRAREAADELGLPIMCHIATAPPAVDEILALMKAGDIITHSYTGQSERLVDGDGALLEAAQRARERGVIFDIGHGSGSFSFESAEALVRAGFWPDVISTDIHQVSLPGPNLLDPLAQELVARVKGDGTPQFTLLTAMSKFLYLGWAFSEVIRATTSRPAEVLGLSGIVGTLRPGAYADVATFVVDSGEYRLFDIHGNERRGSQMIRNIRTIVGGRDLPHKEMPDPPPWIRLVDLESRVDGSGQQPPGATSGSPRP